ncbi:MAG TPA: carboxypeptidase regulatory-like domain-containing protein [Longimicrobiales bacterium]|nr:carboxypeptidase regulatory-like domain-containing protein [Longimicrobiales bacterium]
MIPKETIRRREALPLTLVAGLFLAIAPLEAQQVRGVVIDRLTNQRVMGASVMLVDTTFRVVAGSAANQTGAFRVVAENPGSYFVLVEALGYRPTMDGILDLGEGGSISVEIYLEPKAIELDSIKVAAERVETFRVLEDAGFNERSRQPFGYFITPEEIRRRNPRYFFELFRNTPGVRVSAAGLMGTMVEFTVGSIRGPTCEPRVFVDGVRVNVETGLEAALEVDQIAGVEIYSRPSQVPLQWGGSDSACGVLLFWTR